MSTRRNLYNIYNSPIQFAIMGESEYKPAQVNTSMVPPILQTIKEEEKDAATKKGDLYETIGKVRANLHQDPETLAWFDNKVAKIKNRMQEYIDSGDYHGAIVYGKNQGAEFFDDVELNTRLTANAEYEKMLQDLDNLVANKTISQATADYYKEQNPYVYSPIYDRDLLPNETEEENGRIITGANPFKIKVKPVQDLDINSLITTAVTSITPFKDSNNFSTNLIDSDGNFTLDFKTGVPSNITFTKTYANERLLQEDILAQVKAQLKSNPDWVRQVEQFYNVQYNSFTKNQKRLKELENKPNRTDEETAEYNKLSKLVNEQIPLFYPNGNPQDNKQSTFEHFFDNFVLNKIKIKNISYNYTTGSESTVYSSSRKGSGNGDSKSKLENFIHSRSLEMEHNFESDIYQIAPVLVPGDMQIDTVGAKDYFYNRTDTI